MIENPPPESRDPDVTENSDSGDPDVTKMSEPRDPDVTEPSTASQNDIPIKSITLPSQPPMEPVTLPPLSLTIALRRRRLALFVFIAIVVLVTMTLMLYFGMRVGHFELDNDGNTNEQEDNTNLYNTISGATTTVIGQAVEFLAALMTQVLVLWFISNSVFSLETKWYLPLTALGLTMGMKVLLRSSLDALSIQVHELDPICRMRDSDLSYTLNVSGSSNATNTFSEYRLNNPTINTVLRNLILPRVSSASSTGGKGYLTARDDSIIYGIPQREWMKAFLPTALETSTFHFDLLTNKSTAKPEDFKTNASVIADLLTVGAYLGSQYSVFDVVTPFNLNRTVREFDYSRDGDVDRIPTARLAGLLPPDPKSDETEDRKWLLENIYAFVHAATLWDEKESPTSWIVNVSHVNITNNITVDAITMESQVFPVHLNNTASFRSSTGLAVFNGNISYPDIQIHAYAVCLNDDGVEILTSRLKRGEQPHMSTVECETTSQNSMYIVSSGRHLVAETLKNDEPTKLHVLISTTFARFSWTLENLNETFSAECNATASCNGLWGNLTKTNLNESQVLLANNHSLPLDQLSSIVFTEFVPANKSHDGIARFAIPQQQPVELVSVHRTTKPQMVQLVTINVSDPRVSTKTMETESGMNLDKAINCLTGEILLPHNIDIPPSNISPHDNCEGLLERRAQNFVNNHVYMGTTLHPTYTAGAFFLFQNAMAKDYFNYTNADDRSPLDKNVLELDGNVRRKILWLSTPPISAIITLVGCGLLTVALMVVVAQVFFSKRLNFTITEPHIIARVMMDDESFPSEILKRDLESKGAHGDVNQFCIQDLSLRPVETTKGNDISKQV